MNALEFALQRRAGVGDRFVGHFDCVRDLHHVLAFVQQREDFAFARGELIESLRAAAIKEGKLLRHVRADKSLPGGDCPDGSQKALGILAFTDVSFRAALDHPQCMHGIVSHRENDNTCGRVARENTFDEIEA